MKTSFPKRKIKVLLLENINPHAKEVFSEEGYNVEEIPGSLDEDELAAKINDVFLLGIRSKTKITPKVLNAANRLLAIGTFCIGTDQVDLPAAAQKGVPVFNAPFGNTRSVVELAMGEIIMLLRRVFEKSTKLHQGVWDKSAAGSYEVRGKRLGIVGYGNIGSQLSVVAENLGMKVYYYDIVDKLHLGNAIRCNSLTQLLRNVDVVTIHVDGNPRNKHLIGDAEIKNMKDGAILLNLSRGFVVDLQAVEKHLKSGKLGGAAIDVYPSEPKSNQEPFVSGLQNLPNVILTPHVGGSTIESQKDIASFVPSKLINFVNTGSTYSSVNFPKIQLPELTETHRFIHIHENVPGMLAQINTILGNEMINIEGQYLQTNENLGYVITDVTKDHGKNVIRQLKNIKGTIKFRVLY